MKKLIGTFLVCLSTLSLLSQDPISPLDIPLVLSGNFGELRSNHFHAGIDFKTQGVTGFPVKAVKDGYVSRISVSPTGYGNALYLDHPDGTTSVYAHLERFNKTIEAIVRDAQYQAERFSVNLLFAADEIPVKQGETIALSGNSGSSGGPHLHFEFRDTASEHLLDPLPFYQHLIHDKRPPEIRGVMVFPQAGKGIANGSTANQPLALRRTPDGQLTLEKPITAWGQIGLGVKAYDRMTDTPNIYGVKEIILTIDSDTVHHSVIDTFSFDETRYLNSFVDWTDWIENNSFYMKSFTDPGNRLRFNRQAARKGLFTIDEPRAYAAEYILKDVYGNTARLAFTIEGKESTIPAFEPEGYHFRYHRDNAYLDDRLELLILRGNLYRDVYLKVDSIPGFNHFGALVRLGDRIPLHTACPIRMRITNDVHAEKQQYGIVHHWRDRQTWIGGSYQDGVLTAQVRELGRFSIEVDTIAPEVRPLNETRWTTNRRIAFRISDNLSGIADWRGTLDGEFALFQYDRKANHLYCNYDSARMKRGPQALVLQVTDHAGNTSEYTCTIVF